MSLLLYLSVWIMQKVREILGTIRSEIARYSQEHPEMPISYAVGYALAEDFEGCTMRELFRHADKNMYIDKNQAKIKEAADRRALHIQILDGIRQQGFQFSDCLYCDALQDQYTVLRASSNFFLAEDGSYSGAVEQIVQKLADDSSRKRNVGTAADPIYHFQSFGKERRKCKI